MKKLRTILCIILLGSSLYLQAVQITNSFISCITDFNLDGKTDGADLSIFLGNFNITCTGCPTDLNSDDITNGDDFAIFLGNFGLDCLDADTDGFTIEEGDCNDSDPNIFPGSIEICGDGIINNCQAYCSDSSGMVPLSEGNVTNGSAGLKKGVSNVGLNKTFVSGSASLYILNSENLATDGIFNGTGTFRGSPMNAWLSNGSYGIFLTQYDGLVRRVDLNANHVWSIDLRRAGCASDEIRSSTADIHVHSNATSAFQSLYRVTPGDDTTDPIDLVYVPTSYQCGTTTANRVYAINALNGDEMWVFNFNGTHDMDAIYSKPILDIQEDRLIVATERTSPSQNSLWSINVLTGMLDWAGNYGQIWSAPLLIGDRMYFGNLAGDLYAVNKDDGSEIWNLPTGLPIYYDPFVEESVTVNPRIAITDFFGAIMLIQDMGSSASILWSAPLPDDALATCSPIFFPESEMLYVGADNGKVYQLSMIDGSVTASREIEVGSAITGVVFAPETIDCGGISDERILVSTEGGTLAKFCHPWVSE